MIFPIYYNILLSDTNLWKVSGYGKGADRISHYPFLLIFIFLLASSYWWNGFPFLFHFVASTALDLYSYCYIYKAIFSFVIILISLLSFLLLFCAFYRFWGYDMYTINIFYWQNTHKMYKHVFGFCIDYCCVIINNLSTIQ